MRKITKLFQLLAIPLALASFTSCNTVKYGITLDAVSRPLYIDSPTDEREVYNYSNEQIYSIFEDDIISVSWQYYPTNFAFRLKNLSPNTIIVNWANAVYVDVEGISHPIAHNGHYYTNDTDYDYYSRIPSEGILNDIVVPTNGAYYKNYQIGKGLSLLPTYFGVYANKMKIIAPTYLGNKVRIVLPIIIDGYENEYNFEFVVNSWEEK